jgi:hypothetical protein
MNEKVNAQAVAKEPSNRQVQVDPNAPESPLELIVQASQYLVDEVARLNALAHDASKCDTAYSRAFLVRELAARLEAYQAKGLQALVRIVNDLVDRYKEVGEYSNGRQSQGGSDGSPAAA